MTPSLQEHSSLRQTAGLEMPSLPRDAILEDTNALLILVDFHTSVDGAPCSQSAPTILQYSEVETHW